tara:strand:- start:249 stop:995 length:747 start_codon:yes stop_codon:yes gene_type:complete
VIDWDWIRAVVLDIEGTTCPVDFVTGTLFPYAREHLGSLLSQADQQAELEPLLQEVRIAWKEEANPQAPAYAESQDPLALLPYLQWLIDQDRKLAPLKELQGLTWRFGYQSGAISTPLFADVAPMLQHWHQLGLRLAVYSSGSVAAQQLFYGHTGDGDLSGLFERWYDTRLGPKKEATSYALLAADLQLQANAVLFISDASAELDAAQAAGLQICGSQRPGNPETLAPHWPVVSSLEALAQRGQPGLV